MSMISESPFIDIESIIRDYAKNEFPFSEKVKSQIDFDAITSDDFDFSKLTMTTSDTTHEGKIKSLDDLQIQNGETDQPNRKGSHILFSTKFSNDTERDQTYNLRAERKSRSTCKITMTRALTIGASLKIGLSIPNPVLSANAGFTSNLSLTKSKEVNFEKELTWSLDTQISVKAGYETTADLIIKEGEYDGSFKIATTLSGSLEVKLHDKKSGKFIERMMIGDLRTVFSKKKGFEEVGPNKVSFINEGICHCQFGVEQNVKLREISLKEVNNNSPGRS